MPPASAESRSGQARAERELSERGRVLLAQYQCGRCHFIPGVRAARGSFGPTLQAFGRRAYISGEIPNTEPLLIRWIRDPPALIPGTLMPVLGVGEDDAAAMAAYLARLR